MAANIRLVHVKILGIDYGQKRIGLAIASKGSSLVFPAGTFANDADALDKIINLCKEEDIGQLVLGKPVNLSGGTTQSTEMVKKFYDELIAKTDIEVILFDERRTTKRAEAIMHQMGLEPSKNRDRLNSIAATVILEDYIQKTEKV